MKKGYVLLVILMILVLMAGCSKGQINTDSKNDDSRKPSAQTGDSAPSLSGASPGAAAEDGKDVTAGGPSGGAEVIVKSGSDVASKDKAELLNQIDQELNQMIRDINNLEDISDSDLQ